MLSTETPSLREQVPAAYKPRTRTRASSDKRAFFEELTGDAERGAARGDLTVLTRSLRNSVTKAPASKPLLNTMMVINNLTTEQEQAARWVQHPREVLNHTPKGDPSYPPPADIALDIDTSPLTEEDDRLFIKAMKCGKAASIDCLHAEMLKADLNTLTKVLTDLFRKI